MMYNIDLEGLVQYETSGFQNYVDPMAAF